MAILVTGGAGYIGSHTCVELLAAGEEVVVLDNFSNSSPDALDKIAKLTGKSLRFCEVDLLHEAELQAVFRQYPIESVIHFAGFKAVGESMSNPLRYYRNNLVGTLNLCNAMQAAGCKKLVFSSSATVYGDRNLSPLREDMPLWATNPYGWSKLMIEQMLQDIAAADPAWSMVLLRYFNPIGAHPGGLLGDMPRGVPNNLVPYLARVAIGEFEYLRVFGNDYDTPDGTGVRDYLHVCDLAEGHLDAMRYLRTRAGVEAVNLGLGRGYSVLEVLHAYQAACGREIPYKIVGRRAGDVAVYCADPTKAGRLFGWHARRTLAQMCEDSWRFYSAKGSAQGATV